MNIAYGFINFCMLFFKSSKTLIYILPIFLGIIFGSVNNLIPDYAVYESAYTYGDSAAGVDFEYGYQLLEKMGHFLSLDYVGFRLFIGILSLLILTYALKKFKLNTSLLMYVYFLLSFPMDLSQVRNFMMMVFIMLGFSLFINDRKYKNTKLFLCILIGSSFQSLGYFFLLFFLVNYISKRKIVGAVSSIAFVLISMVFTIPSIRNSLIGYLGYMPMFNNFFMEKMSSYTSVSTHFGFLFPWAIIIFALSIIVYGRRPTVDEKLAVINKIMIVVLLVLPFLTFNVEFYRIFRDVYLIFTVGVIYTVQENNIFKNRLVIYLSYFGISAIHFLLVTVPVISNLWILN